MFSFQFILLELVPDLDALAQALDSVSCNRCHHSAICPSVFLCVSSITLVQPAKAVGRNEMIFGKDTRPK